MARPMGQLQRSLAALTIGMAQGERERTSALVDTAAGEYIQQLRVPVNGVATNAWASVDKAVNWEMPFLYAPLQRRVPFTTPHFHANFEIVQGQGELVTLHAQVVGWITTDADWYSGATVRFAAVAPLLADDDQTAYASVAHLSFQGYATSAEVAS